MKKTVKSLIPSGQYFLQGNEACADGALIAGCRFFGGYPITPSSEIMERVARRFIEFETGSFLQMEDEIGSISAVIGASWTGTKAMTATSGPGFSLMMENIGYAVMTETPCVIVDIQRAGPSTGQATRPAQGDLQQARWGSHGGFSVIALSPWSVQEYLDMTIRAFNLAEQFRVPVIMLADEVIAHAREKATVAKEYEVWDRYSEPGAPPFDTDHESLVPPMPKFGDKEKLLVTGSTHDRSGLRQASSAEAQTRVTWRLDEKINRNRDRIVTTQEFFTDDPEMAFISFGSAARTAHAAMARLRENGNRVGLLKLDTIWPLPEKEIADLAGHTKKIVVPELNNGQLFREVQRIACNTKVFSCTQQDGEAMRLSDVATFAEALL